MGASRKEAKLNVSQANGALTGTPLRLTGEQTFTTIRLNTGNPIYSYQSMETTLIHNNYLKTFVVCSLHFTLTEGALGQI